MDEFRVSVSRTGVTVTVTVVGEVDLATVGTLRGCVGEVLAGLVCRQAAERVVLQVGGVSFMDAAGLGALVELRRLARREGAPLMLAGVPPALWRLLELTGLTGLTGPDDIEDA